MIAPFLQPDARSAPVGTRFGEGMSEVRVKERIRELTVGQSSDPSSDQHPVMMDGHGE